MTLQATVNALAVALEVHAPAYDVEELQLNASSGLETPDENEYFSLRVISDPSRRSLSGEVYSLTRVQVNAYALNTDRVHVIMNSAISTAEANGWERGDTRPLGFDGQHVGLTTDFRKAR